MLLVTILLGVFIVTAGAVNYIFVVRNPNSSGGMFNLLGFSVAILTTAVALLVISVLSVCSPQLIYKQIHWGWLLGVGYFFFAVLLAVAVNFIVFWLDYGDVDFKKAAPASILTVIFLLPVLVLLIVAPVRADAHVYELSEPKDFNLLNNLPPDSKYIYHFEVTDDIDFEGEKTRLVYGREKLTYYIDGNGHTLSGFTYEGKMKKDSALFTAGQITVDEEVYCSKISNITLDGFTLIISPAEYDRNSRIGIGLNLSFFDEDIQLEGVTLNAEVKVTDDTNVRALSPSTLQSVSPENGEDEKGNKFNVSVTGELYKPEAA